MCQNAQIIQFLFRFMTLSSRMFSSHQHNVSGTLRYKFILRHEPHLRFRFNKLVEELTFTLGAVSIVSMEVPNSGHHTYRV